MLRGTFELYRKKHKKIKRHQTVYKGVLDQSTRVISNRVILFFYFYPSFLFPNIMAQPYPTITFAPMLVRHFQNYHEFRNERPEFYCATCCRCLFRIDTVWRRVDSQQAIQSIHCTEWGLRPIYQQFSNN